MPNKIDKYLTATRRPFNHDNEKISSIWQNNRPQQTHPQAEKGQERAGSNWENPNRKFVARERSSAPLQNGIHFNNLSVPLQNWIRLINCPFQRKLESRGGVLGLSPFAGAGKSKYPKNQGLSLPAYFRNDYAGSKRSRKVALRGRFCRVETLSLLQAQSPFFRSGYPRIRLS